MKPSIFIDKSIPILLCASILFVSCAGSKSIEPQDTSVYCSQQYRKERNKDFIFAGSIFFLGQALALAGGSYSMEDDPSRTIQISLSLGAFAGLIGAGYFGYQGLKKTSKINDCVHRDSTGAPK